MSFSPLQLELRKNIVENQKVFYNRAKGYMKDAKNTNNEARTKEYLALTKRKLSNAQSRLREYKRRYGIQ